MKIKSKIMIINILILFFLVLSIVFVINIFLDSILKNTAEKYRNELIGEKKAYLKGLVDVSYEIIEKKYKAYVDANGTDSNGISNVQREIILIIKSMRYDNGVGYYWINDMTRPYPMMIMHPVMPGLDRKIMNDKIYNCAGDTKKNLFVAFADVCEKSGEGYVDYLWPKPVAGGKTAEMPKLGFVRLFKPFNWIIGTGFYIDDVEARINVFRMQSAAIKGIMLFVITLIVTGVVLAFTTAMTAGFSYQVNRINKSLDVIKFFSNDEVDLTKRLQSNSRDELGTYSNNFNKFTDRLTGMILSIKRVITKSFDIGSNLNHNSMEITSSTEVMNYSVNDIRQKIDDFDLELNNVKNLTVDMNKFLKKIVDRIEDQSANINESSSAIEEMISSIVNISSVAQDRLRLVDNLDDEVRISRQCMENNTLLTGSIIKSTDTILNIIKTIKYIASETQILSINARIEAAHAGEYGKGFDVVAEEIRNMSESTAISAKQISDSLTGIINDINSTHQSSEDTGKAIMEITEGIMNVSESFKEISSGMKEMSVGSNQILTSLNNLIEISEFIKDASKSINDKTDNIESSIIKLTGLSNGNKTSINEIYEGMSNIAGSMAKLEKLCGDNYSVIDYFEKEISKFKTAG